MNESPFQKVVSKAVLNQQTEGIHVSITDNENVVLIEVDDEDAAYTADEARKLADALEDVADDQWDQSADDIIEYIRDVAGIVDGEKGEKEIIEKWDLE